MPAIKQRDLCLGVWGGKEELGLPWGGSKRDGVLKGSLTPKKELEACLDKTEIGRGTGEGRRFSKKETNILGSLKNSMVSIKKSHR